MFFVIDNRRNKAIISVSLQLLKRCFKLFIRLFFIFSFSVTFKRSLCFSCMVWVASERSQLFFREIIDVVVVVVRSVVASEGGELVVEGEPGAVG